MKISFPVEPDEGIEKVLSLFRSTWSTAPPRLVYSNGWITTEVSTSICEDHVILSSN